MNIQLFKSIYRLLSAIRSNDIENVRKISSKILETPSNLLKKFHNLYDELKFLILRTTNCDKETIDILLKVLVIDKFQKNNLEEQLKIALLVGNAAKAEWLLINGAKLKGPEWKNDSPAYYALCRWNINKRMRMIKLLIKYGLDLDILDEFGENFRNQVFLHLISEDDCDAVEIAEILIDSKEVTNRALSSLLFSSIQSQNLELISFLLQKGADVNYKGDYGFFPLFRAAEFGNESLIDLLLSKGADINAKNKWGWTAVTSASLTYDAEVIDMLLRKGADISPVHTDGSTPFTFFYSEDSDSRGCRIFMIKEFSKLTFENIKVHEKDMNSIKESKKSKEHFTKCMEELESMASTKFYGSYTYYSVLKMSISMKKLSKLVSNEKLVKEFKENSSKFTYYESDLKKILNAAIQERDKQRTVFARLKLIFGNFLPDIPIGILAKNLTIDELPL